LYDFYDFEDKVGKKMRPTGGRYDDLGFRVSNLGFRISYLALLERLLAS
jgi:hypothetical protein